MKKGIKRRGNGQGCAIRVGPNNYKAIAVIGYRDEAGTKPIRRTKAGFATRAEALAYIPTLKNDKSGRKARMTLIEAYRKFISGHKAGKSTLDCYNAGIKLFSDCYYLSLNDLDIDELQDCIDSAEQGKRTKQLAKTALGLVYKWAIPRGYVDNNVNLAQFLKAGKGETVHKPSFSAEQLEQIRRAVGVLPYADIVYCHCYLGFRPSALLALKSSDYNPKERAFVGGIKTDAGICRTVTVSPKIAAIVDILINNAGDDGYVFGKNGEQISLGTYRKAFYELLERLGIQSKNEHIYTPHSCRHTFATLMKSIDAPDRDKLELIGHTDPKMLQYYQDVNYADLRKITDAI